MGDRILEGGVNDRWKALLLHECPGRHITPIADPKRLFYVFECVCGFKRALRKSEVMARQNGIYSDVLNRERSMVPVAELLNVHQWGLDSLDALRLGCMMIWEEDVADMELAWYCGKCGAPTLAGKWSCQACGAGAGGVGEGDADRAPSGCMVIGNEEVIRCEE